MKVRFVFYDIPIGIFYGLRKKIVQGKKCVRFFDGVPTTVTLAAIPVTFRVGVLRVDLASIRHN